jgi:hypothetical protein
VELSTLQVDVSVALTLMEKAFPPSFFVIQTHLVMHLPREIEMHGPFSPRSMYPWERYMGKLKLHVRNRAQAEASMAEGHKMREMVFYYNCSVASQHDGGVWYVVIDRPCSLARHMHG